MTLLAMSLRALRERTLSSALTAASVALGVGLAAAVLLLEREAREAYEGTAAGVEILVGGDKGGRIDTLLSALYHVGRAPGRVPMSLFLRLQSDQRVRWAVPVAFGDSYRGAPVVGTTKEFFERLRPRRDAVFEVEGALFGAEPRRAVAGADAARRVGLSIGDVFFPAHGGDAGGRLHEHEPFTVSGILRPTGSAHDRAIWVGLHDFLHLRGHEGLLRGGEEEEAVSAIFVKSASPSPFVVEDLIREINDGDEAQAIRPGQAIAELFDLVGVARRALSAVAALVIAVAVVSVMVALHNAMAERRREIALLRALGAHRRTVFSMLLLESALLC
ncbi:MAG: FtsX-like permease family protein, partial [Planctomycetota bacterium]